jgi:molybdate/tungstate transport system substrate-binding protein
MTRPDTNRLVIPIICITALLLGLVMGSTGCSRAEPTSMRVLCAGSLIVPFNELETAFEAEHPNVDVLVEGHGSIQVIRQVTELYQEADVMAVADHDLIPLLMYSTKIDATDQSYADWYLKFATNSVGIAYTSQSRYADEINEANWYEIISRPDVRLGIADPRLDPCGYRTLMVCQLAEDFYGDDEILEEVIGDFQTPITVSESDTGDKLLIPEILTPISDRLVLRSGSVWLISLLESGDVDYAFEYESVAKQHQVEFLNLPVEINLSSEDYAGFYQAVSCQLAFQRFASVNPEFLGQPIIYGVTIPNNAPHPELAAEFIKLLIGEEGQEIMKANYHPMIIPAVADNPQNLPAALKPLIP